MLLERTSRVDCHRRFVRHCDNDFSHIQEAARLFNQFPPGGLHAAEIEFARWKQHWQRQPAVDNLRAVLDIL
jgi:hypothetical protein